MSEQELKVQQKQEVQHSGETTKPEKYFVPAVDIFETDKQVTVTAEMPGVSGEGVDISLEDDVLTIRGSKQPEAQTDARILLQEYETGHYLRRFTVSEAIDQEKIEAYMNDGLLTVVLPKTTPAQPRKIEVKVG
ncbi:MAG TPA: Hsp20/alpha crystallin family protein [Desulfobacteraceae bacterium]|nr:spore protein SP21 [bacterium BMS3Abin13]HDK43799.1 Hsp20/alpha crystallin family protein [Desulfobacteraceae bacterium]